MKLLGSVAVVFAVVSVMSAQTARTVWDQVFTLEQAKRGAKVYASQCGHCHGDTGLGGEGPALTGPVFTANWDGVPLNELVERIRQTMPADNPGNMSREELTDVVAHLLNISKMPAGTTPLPSDAGSLMQIKYFGSRPQ